MHENLGFRPQLTAAATLLHLLADSLQCGTEEKCVLELRRISITLQDKKSLAAPLMPRPGRHSQGGVPGFAAWLADGDPSALSWLGPALLLLSRLSLPFFFVSLSLMFALRLIWASAKLV